MKNVFKIAIIIQAATLVSCSNVKRSPGRVYMPDMAYSRAYETYSVTEQQKQDLLAKEGVHFSNMPVAGTFKRGGDYTFRLPKDKIGDSTNYVASKSIKSPIDSLDELHMKEAERLYLVNCGICHGTALDGNGPLYKNGDGPFTAAPKNLVGDPVVSKMPEGQLYYSVTYGKNMMGSYASQLSSVQRWMVIAYIKSKRAAKVAATAAVSQASASKDSTAKK